jgi:hypothetical protein
VPFAEDAGAVAAGVLQQLYEWSMFILFLVDILWNL